MTGLQTISPAERLLETLRLIRDYAGQYNVREIIRAAEDAIQDYEQAQRVQPVQVVGNGMIVVGEIKEAK